MIQQAKKPLPPMIEQSIISQYLARQGSQKVTRSVSDQFETINFALNSSLRFWYNDSMLPYESHWHGACEMIVPTEGNYLVATPKQTYELTPGDIFFIPSGVLHSLNAPSRGGRFILLFDMDPIWRIKGSAYLASCLSSPVLINRSTCPSFYGEEVELITQICADYLNDDCMRDMVVYTKLLTFFQIYGKGRLAQGSNYVQPHLTVNSGSKSNSEKFNIVFAYLDEHFAEDLTLEHMAAIAGFSKFHFSRTFKQISGYNFYDYLCQRRVKSAEILLMNQKNSVSQIALQSGFSSVSTFNRIFKRMKGCTPTQYRSMFHIGVDENLNK